jgi:hypothetical protein
MLASNVVICVHADLDTKLVDVSSGLGKGQGCVTGVVSGCEGVLWLRLGVKSPEARVRMEMDSLIKLDLLIM